jgi:CRP/FNR family transcriptional regulator, cyclic AMP receptor protein
VLAHIALVGVVATAGMSTFVAGIQRLGPSRASIVSAVQPALTPLLGLAVFADRLSPAQVLGGAIVVAAVVVLETGSRSAHLLAWLPRRERLALALLAHTVEVPAGRRVVRQGADADAFFLIERGRASVERDDRHVRDLGGGDFFGELALLNGGARTASVVAATDMRLRVIPRRRFCDAMRRLPTLGRSVRDAAGERLASFAVPSPA